MARILVIGALCAISKPFVSRTLVDMVEKLAGLTL